MKAYLESFTIREVTESQFLELKALLLQEIEASFSGSYRPQWKYPGWQDLPGEGGVSRFGYVLEVALDENEVYTPGAAERAIDDLQVLIFRGIEE